MLGSKMRFRHGLLGEERFVRPANGPAAVVKGFATVAQFVEARFQPEHIELKKKGGRDHYATILKCHIIPAIGSMQLREVNHMVLQRLVVSKIKAGVSSQTITHIRNAVSKTFRHARKHGFYSGELPTADVEVPPVQNAERRALTWDQVQTLAGECGAFGPLVLLLAATGLRIGEACALRWKNVQIDHEPAWLHVTASFTRAEFTTPKSGKPRPVPLTSVARVVLSLIPRRGDDDLVFFNLGQAVRWIVRTC
jgi:integrase